MMVPFKAAIIHPVRKILSRGWCGNGREIDNTEWRRIHDLCMTIMYVKQTPYKHGILCWYLLQGAIIHPDRKL